MMKVIIKSKKRLNEKKAEKRKVYQVIYEFRYSSDANIETIKTDLRTIKGVAIVGPVPGTEKDFGEYKKIRYKIKFVPYSMPAEKFVEELDKSLRRLSDLAGYGLENVTRVTEAVPLEK
jgi:hypothetical protein